MTPTPPRAALTLSTLEDRLTPADVIVNYFVFFSNTGATVTTGTSGLTNTGVGTTGFTGVNTSSLGATGFGTGATATNSSTGNPVGTNTLGSAGTGFNTTAGTTGVGSFGAGVGGSTGGGGGAGAFGTGTTGTGSLNTLNTGLVSTAGGGTNTLNTFGVNGFGTTGTGTAGTFTTGLNNPSGITGIATGNASNSAGTSQFVGSTGFAFDGTNGVTITTTITPTGVTRTGTGTLTNTRGGTTTSGASGATTNTGGGGTNTNASAAEVAAARGERRAVFTQDGAVGVLLNPFPNYAGELRTAVADVTGDGVADTVVAPGAGGGPRVAVFDGRTGRVVADFFAYDDALRNGVTVGAGDLDGDGRAEVVTGAGPGGGPRVRAFTIGVDGSATRTADFFAFDDTFRGGVSVAVGDADGDGRADILTGAGAGGGPRVDAFTPAGRRLDAVFVGDPNGRGGAAVAGTARAADGTTLFAVGGPAAQLFDAKTGKLVRTLDDGSRGPTTVSVGRGVFGTPIVRVARAGEADRLFSLDGVEVG